jgi:S1-C subfamily serine protease
LSEEIKVTDGIISSLAGIKNDQTRMQITNALQPGGSGGPLTNVSGLVVGVNASVLRGEQYQNINFSVKREQVLQFPANNKIEFSVEGPCTEKKGTDIVRDMKKIVFSIYCASKS